MLIDLISLADRYNKLLFSNLRMVNRTAFDFRQNEVEFISYCIVSLF